MPDLDDDDFGADDSSQYLRDEDDNSTIECPHCGNSVYEDSPRCPVCENYITDEEAPVAGRPWWFFVGVVLALLVFLRWLFV